MFSVWMRGFSYLLNVGSVLCFLMGFDVSLRLLPSRGVPLLLPSFPFFSLLVC